MPEPTGYRMKLLTQAETTATLISWLADISDDQLQKSIIAQRRTLSSRRASQDARSMVNELLTALHREAGRRVARIFHLRSLNS